ncbi:cyclin-A2-1 isoform X1 [Ziziphus jujuba]|uniref:B-like cyclin n=1 Tax=Ziziphus jujuba TaxID=326968 RepID=A0A6P6G878_ZIZJJ|nr:cyclin-A2-1 isoform X1 [Ziziphus jujuba]XP_024930291.2 cyclin-A2-1 isoform X1 [Ziziphus jujuba]XP_048331136.1 cyclin-A2-1 isoform X1 [Ziziphus jujuba]XP_060672990.1 cyclin-A2-1 isoform X1 [Ziziphus jujuba]
MNKENTHAASSKEPSVRITRARAKDLGASGGILPSLKPSFKQNSKRVLRESSKRPASDENKASANATAGFQHKRRAVLKDVTNISCENSNVEDICASEIQLAKRGPAKKNTKMVSNVPEGFLPVQDDAKSKLAEELSRIRVAESEEFIMPLKLEENKPIPQCRQYDVADLMIPVQTSAKPAGNAPIKEEDIVCEIPAASKGVDIVDIDSNLKDPQACSLYAADIYNNIRITEIGRRPSTDYMEMLQQDITPSMRGILIDWLVEVSEEYKLVPDTLYLTVNLIDRFLSHNYIEKQRLQLLGVTCMLIASKYEEICAPRVEEFCFITDNTYSREEVLKMESGVLNFLHFQLSVPTTKTFLRRFIQAAQAFYKAPCVELEFLANYLAELTLVEYSFLRFLPSLIAASAVFLARWTLSQSDHPWNSTLEHYTNYKASDLKTTVVALEDLQLNPNGCALNAIRDKYRQQKFKCVATLTSIEPVGSLF